MDKSIGDLKLMRVLLGAIFHETHSFIPEVAGIDCFHIRRGAELLDAAGDGSPLDGFLEVAAAQGWTVVPTASYVAMPAGTVEDEVFEQFWRDVEPIATREATDLGAIYLVLHGAMVTQSLEDPEGEVLARLRGIKGLSTLPIFGVFDLHANFSPRMADLADGLVTYRENPHSDARVTAVRAANLLARSLESGERPRMVSRHAGIIWPPTGTGTADSPMRDLERLAREIEESNPEIWAVNVIGGYAFSDVTDAGVSFSLVTTGDEAVAQDALDRLVSLANELRDVGLPSDQPIDDVMTGLDPNSDGPILLVEPSDNIGGGAPGDCTGVLRAILRYRIEPSLVAINDPEAVRALASVALGTATNLSIGGKGSAFDEGPVQLRARLISRSDGHFELEDRHSHLASVMGVKVDMGHCAVVEADGVTILLTSRKTPPWDLGQFRSQGIEPSAYRVIGVKAAVGHRQAYDPIAKASHTVLTAGPCSSRPSDFPYKRLRRPVYPLDEATAS
jgi:microcystin degradation protein MlrC